MTLGPFVSMDKTESVAVIIVDDDEGWQNEARSVSVSVLSLGNFRANSQRTNGEDHGRPFDSAAQLDPRPRRGSQRRR